MRFDYQARIQECARQSKTAPNSDARVQWKRMEAFWRERAKRLGPSTDYYLGKLESETDTSCFTNTPSSKTSP
jgi:hypothetical protein